MLIRENPRKSVAKKNLRKKTRRRASHPAPHRSWISRSAFPPLGAASRCTGPTALTRSATFTSTGRRRAIRRTSALQPLRRPTAQPAPGADCRGGRNARATGPRSRAFPISPGNSPSRIASCHRRHRNHRPASFEIYHVFAEATLRENVTFRNRKTFPACAETVDDRTSLWKPEENRSGIAA
jgi:hypothetical protein